MINENKSLTDLENSLKGGNKVVAYFTGAIDSDGVSYCPDCNDAKPAYNHLLNQYYNTVTIISFSIERDEWKDQENQFRKHPIFKVKSIPTLILFNEGIEYTRLVEGQITIKAIDDLLTE